MKKKIEILYASERLIITMSALQASIHCHFLQGQLSAIEYCHVMLAYELSDYVSQLIIILLYHPCHKWQTLTQDISYCVRSTLMRMI